MTESSINNQLKKDIDQLLENAVRDFENLEISKKDRLLKLARDMESLGYPKENICETICKVVSGKGISDDYIRRTLPEDYKQNNKIRDFARRLHANEDKKPIEQLIGGHSMAEEVQNIPVRYSENVFDKDTADPEQVVATPVPTETKVVSDIVTGNGELREFESDIRMILMNKQKTFSVKIKNGKIIKIE